MNNKQLYLLWGIIIAFILVALFPPMDVTKAKEKYFEHKDEYIYVPVEIGLTQWRFIFSKPKRLRGSQLEYTANHIKVVAWTVEFIVLGVVAGGLWFTFGRKGDT